MAALSVATVLAGAGTARAFVTEPGSPYPVGNDPLSLNVADFNGDGRPDVATVNGTSSDVSVFLRQPGGGFAQEAGSPIAVGSGPSNGAVADFNADGLPDLAVANFVSGTVTVLLRQAGGGFVQGLGSPISIGARIDGVAAGDFGGDGRPDLVVARYDSSQATFLLNTGTGFSPQITAPTGPQPGPFGVGDFNGDGLADVAVVNNGGNSVSILLQVAGGGFAAEGGPITVGARPAGIVAADLNGDARTDLAVTNNTSSTVSILLRTAADTGFAEEAGSPIAVSAGPVGITAADLDRDGRPDLAVAANASAVDILRRNPAGGFTRDPAIGVAGSPNGIGAGDFDGDGRPDLAVVEFTNGAPGSFSVLLNPAPAPPPPVATPTPLPAPVAGRTVNVAPVSGTVTIRRPGSARYVRLSAGGQIPVGSSIDTRAGRITITSAQGKGKTASADFYDGLFKLTQNKGSAPVTTLTLTEALSCPKASRATSAATKKKPKTRKLWGDGTGRFRTKGNYSAATVRGTRWLTQDSCSSTLTRVVRGVVSVRDEVKRKTIIVRAGKRYTARRKR